MSMKGTLTKKETNNYGYTTIFVGGGRYGADKKGEIIAEVGQIIEFEGYKNAKGYDTYKSQSLRIVPGQAPAVASGPATAVGTVPVRAVDLDAKDAARQASIVYQSSYDRALSFVDLAVRVGAFAALEKAKPTAKLEVLQSFVDEIADRIVGKVYAAKAPTLKAPTAAPITPTSSSTEDDVEATAESEETWS